jgi:DNA replication ATP-dependent helicase Dna2
MRAQDLTLTDLIDFTKLIQTWTQARAAMVRCSSISDVIDRGEGIDGLSIVRQSRGEVTLRCTVNDSKMRTGDWIEISKGGVFHKARVTSTSAGNLELHVTLTRKGGDLVAGPWEARLIPLDTSDTVISALTKLQPGAPGWSFFRGIVSGKHRESTTDGVERGEEPRSLLHELESDSGTLLDEVQRSAFFKCVRTPPTLAVQGPPGTGKTTLLAFVAEGLARRGRRVLLCAPTHQAVNNALTTIHRLFPSRNLLKVGDELRKEALADDIDSEVLIPRDTRETFLGRSDRIVGMTFLSAIVHLVHRKTTLVPHVVLVEEAGQLPLNQGVCAGLVGASSVEMFGDDMQMPPVFPDDMANGPAATSLFQAHRSSGAGVVMLEVTYRLNSELCRVVGEVFYPCDTGTKLRSSQSAQDRRLPSSYAASVSGERYRAALAPASSLVWMSHNNRSSQQTNHLEASGCSEIVTACLSAGMRPEDIVVVTPFRRQAALIRGMIHSRLLTPNPLPIVDTVERVQGLTADVSVVSLCASSPQYMTGNTEFLLRPNRINVALSRARCKAIIMASRALIDHAAETSHAGRGLRSMREVLARAEVIPLD